MECISPLSLPRPNGLGSIDRVTVPCGKCLPCLNKKRNEWSFRLEQELKASTSAYFVTLTYNEDSKTEFVNKRDVQLFLKRLRKEIDKKTCNTKNNINGLYPSKKHKIRYYLTAEYGTLTKRPHYHAIIFNIPVNETFANEMILKTWQNGFVYIGTVTPASIAYVTKYLITKNDEYEKLHEVFTLISLGIGRPYIDKMAEYHKKTLTYHSTQLGGKKTGLPRYYRERIFNAVEQIGYSNTQQNRNDKRYNDEQARISQLGESPFLYKLNQIEQMKEQLKKRLSKNSKL